MEPLVCSLPAGRIAAWVETVAHAESSSLNPLPGRAGFVHERLCSLELPWVLLAPRARRIVYVASFEILAILLSAPILMFLGGGSAAHALTVAAAVTALAVAWNYIFNSMFETWERRHRKSARTVRLRLIHAAMFEVGLAAVVLPLYMVWYDVGIWQAFKMEAAVLAFFLAFTFCFTWCFDAVFALPEPSPDRE